MPFNLTSGSEPIVSEFFEDAKEFLTLAPEAVSRLRPILEDPRTLTEDWMRDFEALTGLKRDRSEAVVNVAGFVYRQVLLQKPSDSEVLEEFTRLAKTLEVSPLSAEHQQAITALLSASAEIRKQRLAQSTSMGALPTIDSMSWTVDLRPVLDGGEPIGYVGLVLLTLKTSHTGGAPQNLVIQLPEPHFAQFKDALLRAERELVLIKQRLQARGLVIIPTSQERV
jgi:hypothetical protein